MRVELSIYRLLLYLLSTSENSLKYRTVKPVTFTISIASSIKENTTYNKFSIFPTLVTNDLKIDVVATEIKLPIDIVVLNCIGEIIESYSLSNKTNTLNLTHVKSGLYFVNLKSGTSSSIKKIIKN